MHVLSFIIGSRNQILESETEIIMVVPKETNFKIQTLHVSGNEVIIMSNPTSAVRANPMLDVCFERSHT